MFKYIWHEFKEALNRKTTYLYIAGIFALCLIANAAVVGFRMIYGTNEGTYAYNLIEYATWCFIIPYYSCIFIADIAFGKTYPNPQIRNGLTAKLTRSLIYLSKLFVSIILAMMYLVVAFVFLIGLTTIFQMRDGNITSYSIVDFLNKMAIAIPLWIAGLAIAMMCLFMFEKRKMAFIWYFVITLVIPRLIMLLAAEPFRIDFFRFLRRYTISQNFSLIPYPADPARSVPLTIALGIIYTVVATVIGCIAYSRKTGTIEAE